MQLLLPAAVVLGVAVLVGLVPLPLRPAVAVQVLTFTSAVAGLLFVLVLAVLSVGFIGGQPLIASVLESCPTVPVHHRVGWAVGAPAVIGLSAVSWRMRNVFRRRRWAISGTEGRRFAVLEQPEPIAFAAPGTPGCVVVSSGLLGVLEPRERQVVFAHERAHLDQRHDRFLLVTALSTAAVPLLRPVSRRLRHATERCADEAAVVAVGGDRDLVAAAIARVALASQDRGRLGFGGGSVPARVGALLGPPADAAAMPVGLMAAAPFAAAIVGGFTLQIHHFVEVIAHVCG